MGKSRCGLMQAKIRDNEGMRGQSEAVPQRGPVGFSAYRAMAENLASFSFICCCYLRGSEHSEPSMSFGSSLHHSVQRLLCHHWPACYRFHHYLFPKQSVRILQSLITPSEIKQKMLELCFQSAGQLAVTLPLSSPTWSVLGSSPPTPALLLPGTLVHFWFLLRQQTLL